MKSLLTIDAHCDTIYKAYKNSHSLINADGKTHLDFKNLRHISPHIQFFALYSDKRECDNHFFEILQMIDFFYREIEQNNDIITLVKDRKSLDQFMNSGKTGAILALEGAYLLENNLHRLDLLYSLGIRCISLTWNNGNSLCGGIEDSPNRGLSKEGKEAIARMNQMGILIDLSHISKKGFWDIVDITVKPVIATHSNCASLCSHPRNLDDNQIKAIGKLNGVIGINFVPKFLGEDKNCISGIVDHIEHVIQTAGIDCVGLGSDFDGTEKLPSDVRRINDIDKIAQELLKRNYAPKDIEKILGENFLRVIQEVILS